MKTVLITGTSSGIGRAAVLTFQREGWNVIATMRSPEKETELHQLDNVLVTRLDVLDNATILNTVEQGLDRFGQIDVLVNNAGYAVFGTFEMTAEHQTQNMFDTNLFGPMRVLKAVLPHFRNQKSGTVINITSMGGRVTFPACSLYHATKFALEGFTESLAYELLPFNIHAKIVEPGSTATRFVESAQVTQDTITEYSEFVKIGFANWAKNDTMTSTAEQIAAVIYTAATDENDRLRYKAGEDTQLYFQKRQSENDQEYVDYMRQRFIPELLNGSTTLSM
ncbi:SDR family oxidoreductase [Chitinophaga ginsengisoli]|uniref:NADP-dependent 3-hydroxy acid dehydrogenase YdfG n=1 Tax=Chitinophaga ginsengisoli TaxID=363837 RepID=A0A2P8FMS0_9BACT|nr:SDR family oxidoreductase [Chitinophaga ginsengisoli]PSL23020.1 NADP-dependent 3-hydroxy acid dehydrogenase YdfG [Chitinophaga ginsengisoli]